LFTPYNLTSLSCYQVPGNRYYTQPAPVTGKRTRVESIQQGSPNNAQPVNQVI